ncbi:MAG: hypothetical protein QGD89_09560 [Actinomycetota bacterium]|nr:hypothetical protein [Actinomycetota bacterium]
MLAHTRPKMRSRAVATRLLVASFLATSVVALLPHPALASCAELPDIETAFAAADVVFVGRVLELSNGNRTAVMEVEQVWKGPQLPDIVTVEGGPGDARTVTSVDRTFEAGTYIVFPVNSTPPFEDNICTLTQHMTAALDVINPFADEPLEDPSAGEAVTTTDAGDIGTSQTADPVGGGDAARELGSVSAGRNPVPILVVALSVMAYLWYRRSQASS